MRYLFMISLILWTQLASAGEMQQFFSKLVGKWELNSGSITHYDSRGNFSEIILTKLSTTTVQTNENEWSFEESYCIKSDRGEESCFDSTYSYQVISEKLLFVTSEGTTELVVLDPTATHMRFVMHTEDSVTLTNCSFLSDSEMFQEGVSISSDGSKTEQVIYIHKVL